MSGYLAIELTAAWAQSLTPAQMLERLDRRFQLLVSRKRDQTARHRSLYVAIASSYDLLPPDMQSLFRRLSVFGGGFTLEAVSEVCISSEGEPSDTPRVEVLLDMLQEHSLLQVEEVEETLRFSLLENLREFAREQLTAEEAFPLAQRHARWCIRLAQTHDTSPAGNSAEGRTTLKREQDNWRAALRFCFQSVPESVLESVPEREQPGCVGMDLCRSLHWYWMRNADFTEAHFWLEQALAVGEAGSNHELREQIRYLLAAVAFSRGDYVSAEKYSMEGLARWETHGSLALKADYLNVLGNVKSYQYRGEEAETLLLESSAIFEKLQNPRRLKSVIASLGVAARKRGDLKQARIYQEKALRLNREMQDTDGIARTLNNLGIIAKDQSDFGAAETYLRESLAMKQVLGDKIGIANTLSNLGLVASKQNDLALALAYTQQSFSLRKEMQDWLGIVISLITLAQLIKDAEPLEAVRLFAAAETIMETYGLESPPQTRQDIRDYLDQARTRLPDFQAVWDKSRSLSSEAAVDAALHFCSQYSSTPTDSFQTVSLRHK